MSSKGRNQFSDFHPNARQHERSEAEVAREKAELRASRHPEDFGAPHFPPGEKLPPQAKRVALKKRQAAEARAREKARREPGANAREQAARVHGAGEQLEAGQVSREEYPDAAPRPQDARAAARELLQRAEARAQPVLGEAKGHWERAGDAAARLFDELVQLMRVPTLLVRVLLDARKQA